MVEVRWHYGRTGDTGGIPWAHGFGPPAAGRVNEVVGAGPAGLAAAITFAKAERPVRVLERHRSVGQRFHGDMQGLENWSVPEDALDRIRGMGIDADFDYRPFDAVTFYDSQLRAAVVRTPRPLFYLLRRGSTSGTLDTALLRQARAVGAEVRLGETAHTAAPGTILATGPGSADGLVAGFTFSTTLADQAHAIVHPTLAPAGYAYLLIWDGRGTVATSLVQRNASLAVGPGGDRRDISTPGAGFAPRRGSTIRGVRRGVRHHPIHRPSRSFIRR